MKPMILRSILVLTVLLPMSGLQPARAAAHVAVAPVGASVVGFATPVVVAAKAAPLTFVNLDQIRHDFVATKRAGGSGPWCSRYPAGACPVFWTDLIGGGTTAPVQGTANLTSGERYEFVCTVHGVMKGTLIAA